MPSTFRAFVRSAMSDHVNVRTDARLRMLQVRSCANAVGDNDLVALNAVRYESVESSGDFSSVNHSASERAFQQSLLW